MKIVSHTQEQKFLVSLNLSEFKQVLGITKYNLKDEISLDDCILKEIDLQISNAFTTSEKVKSIVNRESFKNMKNSLLEAVRAIEEADSKFCNLSKML